MQNAFKFTRSRTTVTLRVRDSVDRVPIRTGLGIGLAFSRWGAEANGRLYARNLPGTGCVFTVDLPRSSVPATTPL